MVRQLEGNTLHYEPLASVLDKKELPDFINKYQWNEKNLFFGGVNAVTSFDAFGDYRRAWSGIILQYIFQLNKQTKNKNI